MNRKNNLILHGIKVIENSHEGLFIIIKKNILKIISVQIESFDINKCLRLGKKHEGRKDRPILISFIHQFSYQKKVEAMKNKRKMPQDTYITEDFSKEMLDMRKKLQQELKQERDKGNEAFIRNNKLIIREKSEVEKRKREISMSPKCIQTPPHPTVGKNIIAPSKLHKTDAFAYMRKISLTIR